MEQVRKTQQIQATVWCIWGAFFTAVGVYAFVVAHKLPTSPKPGEHGAQVELIFTFLGFAMASTSLILRGMLFRGFKSGMLRLDSPEGMKRYLAGNVLGFALSEGIGVLGLVLGFMGCSADMFFLGGWAMLLWHMPLPSRFSSPI